MFGSTTYPPYPPSSSALGITATPIKPPEDPGFLRFLYGLGLIARGFIFKNSLVLRNVSLGIFAVLAGSYGCAQFISWEDCRPANKCHVTCTDQLPEGITVDGFCSQVMVEGAIHLENKRITGDSCTLENIKIPSTDPSCLEDEPGEGEGDEDPGEGEGEGEEEGQTIGQPEVVEGPVYIHMHDPRPPFAGRVFMSDRCFYNGL